MRRYSGLRRLPTFYEGAMSRYDDGKRLAEEGNIAGAIEAYMRAVAGLKQSGHPNARHYLPRAEAEIVRLTALLAAERVGP